MPIDDQSIEFMLNSINTTDDIIYNQLNILDVGHRHPQVNIWKSESMAISITK